MQDPFPFELSPSDIAYIELDMLYSILSDELSYPWDPTDPATDHYFNTLDSLDEPCESSHHNESQWLRLLRQLDQIWES